MENTLVTESPVTENTNYLRKVEESRQNLEKNNTLNGNKCNSGTNNKPIFDNDRFVYSVKQNFAKITEEAALKC